MTDTWDGKFIISAGLDIISIIICSTEKRLLSMNKQLIFTYKLMFTI